MKTIGYALLMLIGFAVAGAFIVYFDPKGIDGAGFAIFYAALTVGVFSFFSLLRLTRVQAILLTSLLISFLLLQQLRVFTIWLAFILVILVIIIEQHGKGYENN